MIDSAQFNPDWVSPPGDTIATILEERGLTCDQFAEQIKLPVDAVERLICGEAAVSPDLAAALAKALGSTKGFWAAREEQFRQDLDRLRRESAAPESQAWLKDMPVRDMVALGWVRPVTGDTEAAMACLRFFGVPSVKRWRESYKDSLAAIAFRTSKTFASQPGAIAAWMRQGEIRASEIKCEDWDADRFRATLVEIRRLTRVDDPGEFLPELERACAACGVAVVVLRAPKECKASGAAMFLSPSRAMILLSGRYLSDDHFWFTFYHEAGHLVLHGDKYVSVELPPGKDVPTNAQEDEANEFAQNMLIPPEHRADFMALTANKMAVMRFARRIGVSRGVVVGQLQHFGIIKRNQLNDLKHRYEWAEG